MDMCDRRSHRVEASTEGIFLGIFLGIIMYDYYTKILLQVSYTKNELRRSSLVVGEGLSPSPITIIMYMIVRVLMYYFCIFFIGINYTKNQEELRILP